MCGPWSNKALLPTLLKARNTLVGEHHKLVCQRVGKLVAIEVCARGHHRYVKYHQELVYLADSFFSVCVMCVRSKEL